MLAALTRHWELKLTALLIATSMWFFVTSSEKSQVAIAAPVEYEGLHGERVLVGERREAVDVELQGPRWVVSRLASDTVRVRVNLSETTDGESVVQLSPSQVDAPPGVAVTRITPAWVRVTVMPAGQRTVRVSPVLRGMPAPGYTVAATHAEPAAVQIKGPRSTIERRDAVDTTPVDVTGLTASVTRAVGLALPDAVYATRDRTVQVTVEIREEDPMRRKKGPVR
jgi:YbbR domain-containing protein